MTTAARPTFEPARGGTGKGENDLTVLSKQYSSRDMPSHTKLKVRQTGQGKVDELRGRDFRRELEDKERVAVREKAASGSRSRNVSRSTDTSSSTSKKLRLEEHKPTIAELDADDSFDDDDDNDDEDSEDDTAALMAELNKIKRERALEQQKMEEEKKASEERVRMENIMSSNPLLNKQGSNFAVKRRWDDEVVFKNCARGEEDGRSKDKRYINDTLRSDFHKKFMAKYIH